MCAAQCIIVLFMINIFHNVMMMMYHDLVKSLHVHELLALAFDPDPTPPLPSAVFTKLLCSPKSQHGGAEFKLIYVDVSRRSGPVNPACFLGCTSITQPPPHARMGKFGLCQD